VPTSYKVRIWTNEVRAGKRGTTYRVRWFVDSKPFVETFKTAALADSFRSDLVAASRKGARVFGVDTRQEPVPTATDRTYNEGPPQSFPC
jgi:hypothetical protein